jgi:hypothetical protein
LEPLKKIGVHPSEEREEEGGEEEKSDVEVVRQLE